MMGAESVGYHEHSVLERGNDPVANALEYYASRGETPMVWGGAGATRGVRRVGAAFQYELGGHAGCSAGESTRFISRMASLARWWPPKCSIELSE